MGCCIELSDSSAIGIDEEFTLQLTRMGLDAEWFDFSNSQLKSGATDDPETLHMQGRLFCHIRGIAVVASNVIALSRIPKRSCPVTRHAALLSALSHLYLENKWIDFFLGSALGLLDEDGEHIPDNWAIYWHDAERFLLRQGYVLEALIPGHLHPDVLLGAVKANLQLSGFQLTDKQLDLARLAAHGIISNEEALKRLNIIR